MQLDPLKRLTIEEVEEHPWLREDSSFEEYESKMRERELEEINEHLAVEKSPLHHKRERVEEDCGEEEEEEKATVAPQMNKKRRKNIGRKGDLQYGRKLKMTILEQSTHTTSILKRFNHLKTSQRSSSSSSVISEGEDEIKEEETNVNFSPSTTNITTSNSSSRSLMDFFKPHSILQKNKKIS